MPTNQQLSITPFPTTEEVALTLLQWMFSTVGIPTDYNIGSIIRTYSEAIGSVEEIEGITAQAEAIQALVASAYAAFSISPRQATGAVGTITFSTLSAAPLPSGQSVLIPLGTIVQTVQAVQFSTTSSATLVSGTSSINVPIQASTLGANSNVSANTILQIVTGLSYPLAVTNAAATAGGSNAETPAQTLTRFLAYVDSLGLCSPIAVAAAPIGQSYMQETVQFATCYEGWITQVLNNETPTAGFIIYIDNGTGAASANLISVVTTYLSSGSINNIPIGFRPAGVPFSVLAVNPIFCSVQVTGTAINVALAPAITTAIIGAINAYFASINFNTTVELTQITAAVSNVSFGQLNSLSVSLYNNSSVSVNSIAATGPGQRIVQSPQPIVVIN
jgi:uncharacterized phage protein gp47/JayE